jgi:hypothetical protein
VPVQRSKAPRALAAFAPLATLLALSCGHKTETVTRTVRSHAPFSCAPDPASSPYGYFLASGDFDPSIGVEHSMSDVGADLPGVPASTRAIVIDVSAGDGDWRGVADVSPSGDVDVLLWPFLSACALSSRVDAGSGVTLVAIDASHALVFGGVASTQPRAFAIDLTTGAVTPTRDGLLTARSHASGTRFVRGALVAGGISAVDAQPLASAEVFDPSLRTGDFDHQAIPLGVARSDHGAIDLGTGETLLVGGRSASSALRSLEIVDPATRSSRGQGLASLAVARSLPTVLRLANGEILVAGGVADDGTPVSTLEWFTADATRAARNPRELVAREKRAFVALPGGGALAVIAPRAGDVAFSSVWVISADGDPEPATPIAGALAEVALFTGSDGRPLLWTGDRWLRWSPWEGAFGATDVPAPDCTATPFACPSLAIASPDPGLALFLGGDGTAVTGLRFAARSAYGSIAQPLLVADTSFVAPDRLVLPGTTTSFAFDAERGLTLASGAAAFVTDLTFADFALDLDAPTGEPPVVVLRDGVADVEIGGLACPFGAAPSIHVERVGTSVRVGSAPCGVSVRESARLAIGLRGSASGEESIARNLRIARR